MPVIAGWKKIWKRNRTKKKKPPSNMLYVAYLYDRIGNSVAVTPKLNGSAILVLFYFFPLFPLLMMRIKRFVLPKTYRGETAKIKKPRPAAMKNSFANETTRTSHVVGSAFEVDHWCCVYSALCCASVFRILRPHTIRTPTRWNQNLIAGKSVWQRRKDFASASV